MGGGGGGELQCSVLTWRGCKSHNSSEGMLTQNFFLSRCSEIDSESFWGF